jgi:hypothetical protein
MRFSLLYLFVCRAPRTVAAGDLTAVFEGVEVPYLLRPVVLENTSYSEIVTAMKFCTAKRLMYPIVKSHTLNCLGGGPNSRFAMGLCSRWR